MFEKIKNVFSTVATPELKKQSESQAAITPEELAELEKGLHPPFVHYLENENKENRESAVEAIANLALELKEKLPEYDTVLSDDVSGRLPSLVFYKIINNLKKASNPKQKSIQLFFISGGIQANLKLKEEKLKNIKKFLENKNLGKTLLVTEVIMFGESIEKIAEMLSSLKVNFDIATVSLDKDFKDKKRPLVANHLYAGTRSNAGMNFWAAHSFTGVEKEESGSSPHPKIYKKSSHFSAEEILRDVKQSRKDASILADRISELLKKK